MNPAADKTQADEFLQSFLVLARNWKLLLAVPLVVVAAVSVLGFELLRHGVRAVMKNPANKSIIAALRSGIF